MTESTEKKTEDIKQKLDSFDWGNVDDHVMDEYIRQLENLFSYEEARIHSVESKSTTILSASGLIVTFMFGVVGLYQKWPIATNRAVLVIMGVLLLASLALLLFTIIFSLRVHGIKKYTYPSSIDSTIEGMDWTITHVKKERLSDLIYSFTKNFEIINQKVDYLQVSQRLFSYAVTLVIVDAFMIIIYSVYHLCK